MNLREQLQKHGKIALGVLLILVALVLLLRGGSDRDAYSKAFYSDDDGKTWFSDRIDRVVPFDSHGREAVRAFVFKNRDGAVKVLYLQRLNADGAKKMMELEARHAEPETRSREAYAIEQAALEAKHPGGGAWTSIRDKAYAEVIAVPTADLSLVSP